MWPFFSTGKCQLAHGGEADAGPDLSKAIGDAARRTILDELSGRGGQTLFEICGRLTMRHGLTSSRQAIPQHFAVLGQAGLVHSGARAGTSFHHIDTALDRRAVAY